MTLDIPDHQKTYVVKQGNKPKPNQNLRKSLE